MKDNYKYTYKFPGGSISIGKFSIPSMKPKQEEAPKTEEQAPWPYPKNMATDPDHEEGWDQAYLGDDIEEDKSEQADPIQFVHVRAEGGKGGVTIAYRKLSRHSKDHMVEIAVAYCNKKDTFVKRLGKQLAEERFVNGNTITIPVPHTSYGDIPWALRDMFWYNLVPGVNREIW